MAKIIGWLLDNLSFLVAITSGVLALILLSLGSLPNERIPPITLAVLIGLTFFLGIKNYRLSAQVDRISAHLEKIENKVEGMTSAVILHGTEAFFQKLNSVFNEYSRLDVTYFTRISPDEFHGPEAKKYWKSLATHFKKSTIFRVRRIVTIESREKLDWVKQNVANSRNTEGYHLAVFVNELCLPLLNIIVIDGRHTFIFEPHRRTSDTSYIYVDNDEIGKVAQEYFDNLWLAAEELKVGLTIREEVFSRIEQSLRDANTASQHIAVDALKQQGSEMRDD